MNWKITLDTLAKQVADTKRAYQKGTPGIEYDDMKAAAQRLLTMRRMYEQATGKPVKSDPNSSKQVAALLR